jgi:alcohol dehydrogenase class IV
MIQSPGSYDFFAPQRILFGWGRRRELGAVARELGPRVFVVSGSRTLAAGPYWAEISSSLTEAGIEQVLLDAITHEPEVDDVDRAAQMLRDRKAGQGDWLLAIGGGSAIDLAKAASAMATNRASTTVKDYLEGVGRGLRISEAPLPLVAMPTTGGTGTEATKNAVISSYDPPFKKSLRSNMMVPRVVLVDPELSTTVPASTTAWTGMDAITQLLESYLSRNARPIPQALAVDGLRRALPAIGEAVLDGKSRPARESLAHAALLSGIALANSGLGLAHGVAAALGSVGKVPHGLACAVMLPVALRTNRETCETSMATLARSVLPISSSSSDAAAADALIEHIQGLCDQLNIPRRLGALGIDRGQLAELVPASRGNSMNGNPRQLTDDELRRILEDML